MVIAADYPFLDIFWSMIIFFCWVIWIWMVIAIFADLFSRHDVSGWVKAAWSVFIIVVPFLGVLVYLIANSTGMAQRNAERARKSQQQFAGYVQSVANGSASELAKAKQLRVDGTLSPSEFDALKAKIIA